MDKGIFWVCKDQEEKIRLITVKTPCDKNGTALLPVYYTSKSGDNFNHKTEWKKLNRGVTCGHSYNYYPRGRVEVKNGKITLYANPILLKEDILLSIIQEFSLEEAVTQNILRVCADGSSHYQFQLEEKF